MDATEIRELLAQPWKHGVAVDLRGVRVADLLDLSDLAVCGVDFTGAVFEAGLNAKGAQFDGLAWFKNVQFGPATDFSGAMFVNDARFDAAAFNAPVSFANAEFRGVAGFALAQFPAGADFRALTCYGNIDLAEVHAQGTMNFADSEFLGGLWANGTILPADTDFSDTQVHGRLWLRGARRGDTNMAVRDFGLSFGYTWT